MRVFALSQEAELFSKTEKLICSWADLEIQRYSNSLDFLENYIFQHADLIILDIDLLRDQVLKLIKIIRGIRKNSKIILILSPEQVRYCTKEVSLEALFFLVKPILIETAVTLLYSILQIPTHQDVRR